MAALPFVLTAAAAILLSLAMQALLWPRVAVPAVMIATNTAAPPRPAPSPAPRPSPAPTARPNDAGALRLTILDLQAENRQLWAALYLLRAASQIDDAVAALQANDGAEADRALLAARRSLDRAYTVVGEQSKGPIDSFRLQLSQIRDDMGLRPEGGDRRLRQLRRLLLALVDEG